MRRTVVALLLVAMAGWGARSARAAVNIERQGSENPMIEVFKSTIYGGLAGLVVGSAIALAAENGAEPVRWGFVAGTFVGLGAGIIHVSSRPQPTALLELGGGRATSGGFAAIEAAPGSVRVHAIAVRF
jgi:hypothetical protein